MRRRTRRPQPLLQVGAACAVDELAWPIGSLVVCREDRDAHRATSVRSPSSRRSGRTGNVSGRQPVALKIALPTDAAGLIVATLAEADAATGHAVPALLVEVDVDLWGVAELRDAVVLEVGREGEAGVRVEDLVLVEREPDALDDRALTLAAREHRGVDATDGDAPRGRAGLGFRPVRVSTSTSLTWTAAENPRPTWMPFIVTGTARRPRSPHASPWPTSRRGRRQRSVPMRARRLVAASTPSTRARPSCGCRPTPARGPPHCARARDGRPPWSGPHRRRRRRHARAPCGCPSPCPGPRSRPRAARPGRRRRPRSRGRRSTSSWPRRTRRRAGGGPSGFPWPGGPATSGAPTPSGRAPGVSGCRPTARAARSGRGRSGGRLVDGLLEGPGDRRTAGPRKGAPGGAFVTTSTSRARRGVRS